MVSWINGPSYRVLVSNDEVPVTNGHEVIQRFNPVIGDQVSYAWDDNRTALRITGLRPRRGVFARLRSDSTRRSGAYTKHIIAANLDVAVIVVSAVNPPFHPRFVDRYLIACQLGDVQPVVCVNKIDELNDDHPAHERLRDLNLYRDLEIDVVFVSAVTGAGMNLLQELLYGHAAALVGHSGVGKTTIINRLLPGLNATTSRVSAASGKGRHTTTGSQVYRWDTNSYLIDTPGIRALAMERIAPPDLRYYFPELDRYANACKYADCTHDHEPNCAVKEALDRRAIPRSRYESYVRLLREAR